MTRARRNAKRKHPTPASAKPPTPVSNTLLVNNAIIAAAPGPKPSIAQATAHPVDMERYSARERSQAAMAMDFNGTTRDSLTFVEATGFPGFPTLSLLGQLAEYRTMHETLADECVRMWGKVTSAGESDPNKLADIEAELRRVDVRALVRQAVVHDQAFGGAHVYFKLKGDEDFRDTPLVMGPYTVRQGAFEGLRVVEPYWVTPNFYNSIDPTAADFYKPSSWWMLGIQVHATRLQTIISRPVADMLKPAYSFRGVSMTQLAAPYVDNWLRTRQSVSDTVKQFSVSGIATDLQQALAPGALMQLQQRAELLNAYRDNRNLFFLDKSTEEFFQVNTPLSGLDALQAQAQEQMAAVSHIPLVKLLGITPTGLNASSDGEIRVFYDYVRGYQSNVLHPLLQNVLRVVQLSLFGAIDPGVSWTWEPLEELSALEDADRRNKDATSDQVYMEAGVVTPQQVAEKLAADPRSGYAGILDEGEPEPADDDIEAITKQILSIGNEGVEQTPDGAMDAEFNESDHPRAANGQFGSGGGSGENKGEASAFERAKAKRDSIEARLKAATARAEEIVAEHGGASKMGLTPDAVKQLPEWQKARAEIDQTMRELQHFNASFTKTFKKELAAERRAKYGGKP